MVFVVIVIIFCEIIVLVLCEWMVELGVCINVVVFMVGKYKIVF